MRRMCILSSTWFRWIITVFIFLPGSKTQSGVSNDLTTKGINVSRHEANILLQDSELFNVSNCNSDDDCFNGGKCQLEADSTCHCRLGTSGIHCETVEECVQGKCKRVRGARCIYDKEKEKAVCHCKKYGWLFDEETSKCRESCKYDYYCWYDGKCVNNFCECPPGTRGDDCRIVEPCITRKDTWDFCGDPDGVYCDFNTSSRSPWCHCRIMEYFYDTYDKKCKDCDCGPDGNCTFVLGNKTCACKDGFAVNDYRTWPKEGLCQECKCGSHSDGCTFDGYYSKVCNCETGYMQNYDDVCEECNCGPHGKCYFHYRVKKCDCDEGYSSKDGTCEVCDCGPYGNCSFVNGNKTCECQANYAVDGEQCKPCNCYLDEVPLNCTFNDLQKNCACSKGYEQIGNQCTDIDECINKWICPFTTICNNTPGSYECECKPGFRPNPDMIIKTNGCEDIDECEEIQPCPYSDTTFCVNTIGSYTCECKSGYFPQPSIYYSQKYAGCIEDQSHWRAGYFFLTAVFILVIFALVMGIFHKFSK